MALTGATAKQLKRVVEIQPSVLPLVQTLDLRRGVCLPHHVKSIAKHDRHSCRSTVSLALDRLSPAFINIHTLFLPARQAKDFDYTRFPMLDLVHIGGFHRKPKLEDVVGMLMPLKHVRTIELGPVSNSYATDAEDARDDAVLQTLWNGSEIAVKQPAAAAHDEEQDTDEDEMAPPPPPAQLPRPFYEYLMDYRQLRHLVLLDQLWCQPAMWSAACAYPQLHSLTIGCGTLSLTNLDIILGHLSPTLQQLQLDVSHHNESWWNAHDAEMTLSNMSVLVELDLVQHGGPRVHGPVRNLFPR